IETRIKQAADEFTKTIVNALHGLTLTELMQLVQAQGAGLVRRAQRKRTLAAKAKPTTTAKAPAKPKAKKASMSPKQAAARKVQGQFLGLLRKFKGAERARIKNIGKKNGVPAAVATMKKKLGRS
ncbi:MAG: hypothetical protein JXB32_06195, partial [Deltaproteobacteria bacterium]|nr:hypothetical protein [Deltaproteobacteria bacterium]